MQRRRARKPLSLDELKGSMSTALIELETLFMNDSDPDRKIRAINSLATLANSYSKLTEAVELEARISKLEGVLNEQ